jgi:hypothetical protein
LEDDGFSKIWPLKPPLPEQLLIFFRGARGAAFEKMRVSQRTTSAKS